MNSLRCLRGGEGASFEVRNRKKKEKEKEKERERERERVHTRTDDCNEFLRREKLVCLQPQAVGHEAVALVQHGLHQRRIGAPKVEQRLCRVYTRYVWLNTSDIYVDKSARLCIQVLERICIDVSLCRCSLQQLVPGR